MTNIISTPGRVPFEWIEIDQPLCANTYGVAPCAAAVTSLQPYKCFNTRATCQSAANYDGSDILTLYFCANRGYIPDDHQYEPYLQSVSIAPAKINPGGGNNNATALGNRATLSVQLSDHPHTDVIVDPYLVSRDYDPYDRSTFWAKWRSRNEYYLHNVIRHNSGYIDPTTGFPDPSTLITRTFFITDFSGPSGESVSITAKDILTLASNEKAKAPIPTKGKLQSAITDTDTSLTLIPAGIGDDEYGYSGKVRIGSEVLEYTRATGSDVLDVTGGRGASNTLADAHNANDSVQACLEYTGETAEDILYDLLVNYAGIDPIYIDSAAWAAETATYLPRTYSRIITEPTGVIELITGMSEQMYFVVFWDERDTTIKYRAIRPATDDDITDVNDDSHMLENSVKWNDKPGELITQVWVYYAQIDPTVSEKETTNYAALDIIGDSSAEGADRYNVSKVKEIYAPWITGTNGAAAVELGEKILDRYNSILKECTFSVDAKDRGLWLGDFIRLTNRNNVDFYGLPASLPMQIVSAGESRQGTTFTYTATEYSGGTTEYDPNDLTVLISADTYNLNLIDAFSEVYDITPVSGQTITFTINQNVTIGGLAEYSGTNRLATAPIPYINPPPAHDTPALVVGDTGTWPAGWPTGVILKLKILANGKIIGQGGNSQGSLYTVLSPSADGGDAITVGHPLIIDNYGIIGGGGGGGAPMSASGPAHTMAGGGGAGAYPGQVVQGEHYRTEASPGGFDINNYPVNGYGSTWSTNPNGTGILYFAGDGGALGENGTVGYYIDNFGTHNDGVNFGIAGRAIVGVSNVTYNQKGTVIGAEV